MREAARACTEIVKIYGRAAKIFPHAAVANNRAGDELRKKCEIGSKSDQAGLGRSVVSPDIYEVGYTLECKKRNPDRQDDGCRDAAEFRRKDEIKVGRNEICVFEPAQD